MKALITSNELLLNQAIFLIRQQTEDNYLHCCEMVFSSSTGQHIRHCIEHYEEFLQAIEEQRELDYEKRPRELRVETDPLEAIRRLEAIRFSLVTKLVDCHEVGVRDNGALSPASSSISRELQFLLSHTVHHFALISVIASICGWRVPRDFGIAPSTLKFRDSA